MSEEETTENPNTPSVIDSKIRIPEPVPLKFADNQDDTLRANIESYNTMLAVVHGLWAKANSFGKAIALISQVEKLIKLRAEIMGHPYGVSARETQKRTVVYPDD